MWRYRLLPPSGDSLRRYRGSVEKSEAIVSKDKLSEVLCRHNLIARYVRKEAYAQGVADTLELLTKRDRRSPYTSRGLRANAARVAAALDEAAIRLG
jgi:hypothetical protein